MDIVDRLNSEFRQEQIDELISKKLEEYHHLIINDTAKYLVALQKYGIDVQIKDIMSAKNKPIPVYLKVRIKKVYKPQIFDKGLYQSRIQRMEVYDHSADATIVCYDEPSKIIDQELIREDLIQIGPLKYVKNEFKMFTNGKIKLIQRAKTESLDSDKEYANFEGIIINFFGDFLYNSTQRKLNGNSSEQKKMTSFEIENNAKKCRVIYWDSPGLENVLKKGMHIRIENGRKKEKDEIHIGYYSRLVFKAEDEKKRPLIEDIITNGDYTIIKTDKKDFKLKTSDAIIKMGAGQIPDGVNANTIVNIIKKGWIGKPIPKKIVLN